MPWICGLIAWTAIFASASLLPSQAIASFYDQRSEQLRLEREVSYREDKGETIEAIASATAGWVSQGERPWQGNDEPVRLWARFDLPVSTTSRRVYVITGAWERVAYFAFHDHALVARQLAGTLVPWSERTAHVSMVPSFALSGFAVIDVPAGARMTVYARLATDNRFENVQRLRFSIWDEATVLSEERLDRLIQGAFLGILLMLALSNLAMYFLEANDASYLYYVGSLVGIGTAWLAGFGLGFELLWPDHPAWDHYVAWVAVPSAVYLFGQFARRFLGTAAQLPSLDAQLKWFLRFCAVALPVCIVLAALFPAASTFFRIQFAALPAGAAIVICGASVISLRAGLGPARLFSIAVGCAAVGSVLTFVSIPGILPLPWATIYSHEIGFCLTGLILSIGLGFRMRDLRAELAGRQVEEARLRAVHEQERYELVEQQSRELERKVAQRTAEVVRAQEKSDALLANILPRAVIEELTAKGASEPRRHEEVSILFTDFAGFTEAVSTVPAKHLVAELDAIFRGFDEIVTAAGLEKIKTIGDAYMAACGLPVAAQDHASTCVRAALAMTRFIDERNASASMKWGLRIGIHSGTVIAGIVGKNKYAYDVWGDTVNIASRLESAGAVGRVNVSAYTHELVRRQFECEYRGKVAAKGKGEMDMYFVVRERAPE